MLEIGADNESSHSTFRTHEFTIFVELLCRSDMGTCVVMNQPVIRHAARTTRRTSEAKRRYAATLRAHLYAVEQYLAQCAVRCPSAQQNGRQAIIEFQ